MPRAKWVMRAFLAQRKAGNTILLPDGGHLLAPAGENFVRVALMTHIPDESVARCVKDMVHGDGQFNHAQARTQVSSGAGNTVDRFSAQLVGKLRQLFDRQITQIGRRRDPVKERRG